ncbi:MAG: hypothetical protein JSW34_09025, partial [Candidatus Zixiibacteriota bacterium]
MRISAKLAVAAMIVLALSATALGGKKDRKLSVGAYLSSAKIEIISGDIERYETAITYLDSLFLNYGPHAEGLHLMGQIMVDYLSRTSDPDKKLEYVERLVAYNDSLHLCCNNKEIKKKHRKDCDKFTALSDSTLELHWRESYNSGIEQLNRIGEIQRQLASETDSSMKAMLQSDLQANADSCVTFMRMAVLLKASDSRGYVGVGSAYEKTGESEKAIEWLQKGLSVVSDSSTVLFSIAYNYIQLDRFCDAIPFFKKYTELNPDDTITLYNLAACYNNCRFLDSAALVNRQILQYAPQNRNALNSIGQYFGQVARDASDSVRSYQDAGNEEQKVLWTGKRNEAFDSSAVYYKR